jgi:hypothetical protein
MPKAVTLLQVNRGTTFLHSARKRLWQTPLSEPDPLLLWLRDENDDPLLDENDDYLLE